MRRWNAVLSMAGACALVLGLGATASADVIANYEMEEGVGDTVLVDSGPNALNGTIGSLVTRRVFVGTDDYGFTFSGPRTIANHERLANVPDDVRLDPGTQPYRVSVRFRTTNGADPNIVQKGQSGQTGGYWKVVLTRAGHAATSATQGVSPRPSASSTRASPTTSRPATASGTR